MYDLKEIRALQLDTDELYKRMNLAIQGGWATVADARRAVGLTTSEDDEYYIRSTAVVEVQKDAEQVATQPEEETVDPEEDQIEEIELASAEFISIDSKEIDYKVIKEETDEEGKDVFCVYNETETRSFGCYPTMELAESRLAQIHRFGESQYEDLDQKAEISKDVFDNIEQARERAEELGCSGTHTHDDEGNLVYMPCSTHEEYEKRIDEQD
jgi:hypothetical protein